MNKHTVGAKSGAPVTVKTNRIRRHLWFVLALAGLTPLAAFAAGFDCKKASSPQEKLICMDYRLSDLDSQLTTLYSESLGKSPDKEAIKQQQKRWLEARKRCKQFECVMRAYIDRISELAPGVGQVHILDLPVEMPWNNLPPPEIKDIIPHLKNISLHLSAEGILLISQGAWIQEQKSEKYWLTEFLSGRPANLNKGKSVATLQIKRDTPFGANRLDFGSGSYGECMGELEGTGLQVAKAAAQPSSARVGTKHLLALKPENWSIYRANTPDCEETGMRVHPIDFHGAVILNHSLFLSDDREFVIRFDEQLNTGSELVGSKVFLPWAEDIVGLVRDACKAQYEKDFITTKYYACVDTKLYQLIETVKPFYPRKGN